LTVHQIHQVLANLSGADSVSEISTEIAQFWSKHVPCDSRRHHVILLLDKVYHISFNKTVKEVLK